MKAFVLFLLFSQMHAAFAANSLMVGLASKDITPKEEELIPLGGYGSMERREWFNFFKRRPHWRMFRPAKGVIDPIRAKVMFLDRKESSQKLLFISLDVIGVTKEMHRDLMNRLTALGFDSASVIVSGTHTHSGPGALAKNPVWEIMAMDRFQREYYDHFLDQVVSTVKEAMITTEESELFTISFPTQELVRNRRGKERPVYPDANLLLARSMDGEWRGGIVNFAVHGTWHGASNMYFSSDVPGAIEKSMQDLLTEKNSFVRLKKDADFLFINGAEGDIAPHVEYHELGNLFAKQASNFWHRMVPLVPEWEVIQKEIELGKPKINLSKCVEQKWMPKTINLGVKRWISSKTIISQIHFKNIWFLTWPGEATTELGMMLREQANEQGAESAWVLGLSNDHLAYFVTPDEYSAGGYEACTNFFGEQGGLKIIEAHNQLSKKF